MTQFGAPSSFTLAMAGQTTTGDTVTFNALVTEFVVSDEEVDKVVTFKASLKITGVWTFTEGS